MKGLCQLNITTLLVNCYRIINTENDSLNSFLSNLMPNTFKKDSFNVQRNWKDALISQLYSTLDFLKTEIKGKNVVITALLATLTRDDKASNRSNVPDYNCNNSAAPSLISSYVNGDLIQFSDASFNKKNFHNVTTRKKSVATNLPL